MITFFVILIISLICVSIFLKILPTPSFFNKNDKNRQPSPSEIINKANKLLLKNPNNPDAIDMIANAHYQKKHWAQAFKSFELLFNLRPYNHATMNQRAATSLSRYGIAAFHAGENQTARDILHQAAARDNDNADLHYTLSMIEYNERKYHVALHHAKQALTINHNNERALRLYALCLFHNNEYEKAILHLGKIATDASQDWEVIYTYATALDASGKKDSALPVAARLARSEAPYYSARAYLMLGNMLESKRRFDDAKKAYAAGLGCSPIDKEVEIELYYRLGKALINTNNLEKGMPMLQKVEDMSKGYKDVAQVLRNYQDVYKNSHIRNYMFAQAGAFLALCEQIIARLYAGGVTVLSSHPHANSYVDIFASVEIRSTRQNALFRFFRSTGQVGELAVRELASLAQEKRADYSICVAAGNFSIKAKEFSAPRAIDMIDQQALLPILEKIAIKQNA